MLAGWLSSEREGGVISRMAVCQESVMVKTYFKLLQRDLHFLTRRERNFFVNPNLLAKQVSQHDVVRLRM